MAFVFALMIAVYFIGTQNTYAQSGSFEWRGTVDDRVEIVLRAEMRRFVQFRARIMAMGAISLTVAHHAAMQIFV